ncbi:MAG: PAS domain S-box protein, partial [Candidatus Levybacteria bacterium]|nr:PAS domain S-box protein [Candidatus Levybacteria bacterium]
MQYIQALLSKVQQLASDTYEYTFSIADSEVFTFKPGQYIWLIMDHLTHPDSKGERRAFSISSSVHEKNSVSILFRASQSGYKQTLLQQPVGTKFTITQPFGSTFVIDEDTGNSTCFIANGTGVSSFLSVLRSQQNKKNHQQSLIFINTTHERVFLIDELQNLTNKNEIAFVNHVGSFEIHLLPESINKQNTIFYISGGNHAVQHITDQLLNNGVPFSNLRFEQNYPMFTTDISEMLYAEPKNDTTYQNYFRKLVDSTNTHMIVTDENGFVIYANAAAQKITGFTFPEMIGQTPRLWGGLMEPAEYQKMWKVLKEDLQPFVGQLLNRRKNGQLYYASARVTPIIEHGKAVAFIGSEEDITERVVAEKEVVAQKLEIEFAKKQDEAMLNSIGEGILAHDVHENIILVNQAAVNMLGFSHDELMDKQFHELVSAEDEAGQPIPHDNRSIHSVLESGEAITRVIRYQRKDGSKFMAQVTSAPIKNEGAVIGVIQALRDITKEIEIEIDKTKTEFISLASHQLRTPLSAVSWNLELLRDADAASQIQPEHRKFIDAAYDSTRRMIELVNALLNVTRIEMGNFMVEPEPTDIGTFAAGIIDELQMKIHEKNLTVSITKDDLPLVPLDQNLIRIVIQNFLTNAIKYTPPSGNIQIN